MRKQRQFVWDFPLLIFQNWGKLYIFILIPSSLVVVVVGSNFASAVYLLRDKQMTWRIIYNFVAPSIPLFIFFMFVCVTDTSTGVANREIGRLCDYFGRLCRALCRSYERIVPILAVSRFGRGQCPSQQVWAIVVKTGELGYDGRVRCDILHFLWIVQTLCDILQFTALYNKERGSWNQMR